MQRDGGHIPVGGNCSTAALMAGSSSSGHRRPFCEGARVLLAEGCDPAARFVMRHDGSTADALRSTVGVAAKLMVEEGDRVPQFRRWKPSPHADVTPPMRQNEPALT